MKKVEDVAKWAIEVQQGIANISEEIKIAKQAGKG